MRRLALALLVLAALPGCGTGGPDPATRPAVPVAAVERPSGNPLNNAYFGDLHVHTALSYDSFVLGNRLSQQDAYRFARGEALTTAAGETVKLARPLDFVALTDHAEQFHLYQLCVAEPDGPAYKTPSCEAFRTPDPTLTAIVPGGVSSPASDACPSGTASDCRAAAARLWTSVRSAAEAANQPGKFTAFIAYEYATSVPESRGGLDTAHMHRNVIFANSDVPDHAESARDSPRNVELWKWLERACTGPCDAVAIPHNSNFSWGFAFALETQDHKAYTRDDWGRQARYERLAEIFQIKGNSECGVGFGTTDEECGFNAMPYPPCATTPRGRCYGDGSFVRNALKTGLLLSQKLGVHAFKFGFVGGTDTHNSIPGAVEEDNYVGATALADGSPEKRLGRPATTGNESSQLGSPLLRNPGGLTGIWAPENTRAALFAAMKRRETFATSGTRMQVRFFGGWTLPADLAGRREFVARAYRAGVPMGGDLPAPGAAAAPSFLVWAARDPLGQPLQRIQVVKAWVEGQTTREAVYDVACSDGLTPDPETSRCPSNGATVDLADCRATPRKGAAELKTVWRDPAFDRRKSAFYYVRVLENPSCRWNALEALRVGRPMAPFPSPIQQERAWSSPIWYEAPPVATADR